MAVIAVIFGGMSGFLSALVALILFNASWLIALSLWALGGFAVAALLLIAAKLAPQPRRDMAARHA